MFCITRVRLGIIHLIPAEDLGHMFIEPFDFISSREGKVLNFLDIELRDLLVFVLDPLRRPHGQLRFGTQRHDESLAGPVAII